MELFAIDNINFEDLYIDIKYNWTSFDWVMNIHDLWNELLWIEYCLKTIFFRRLKEDKQKIKSKVLKDDLKYLTINDFEIITEWFVNNCFLKRIKFKKTNWIIKFLNQLEKRPELNKYILTFIWWWLSLYWAIYIAQINADKDIFIKALEKWNLPESVIEYIQQSSLSSDSKRLAQELLLDKRFREESAKTVIPIKEDQDTLELNSKVFGETIKIDKTNKEIFLLNKTDEEINEWEYVSYDVTEWRINSMDLDASKNQIGFKVLNEGTEINCHLIDSLNIEDYKELLWEWVEIEWNITYSDTKVKYIEIHRIAKIDPPLSEAKQTTFIKK